MATIKKEVEIRKCDWCKKEISDMKDDSVFIGWYQITKTTGICIDVHGNFINTKQKDFCCLECLHEYVSFKSEMKKEGG